MTPRTLLVCLAVPVLLALATTIPGNERPGVIGGETFDPAGNP